MTTDHNSPHIPHWSISRLAEIPTTLRHDGRIVKMPGGYEVTEATMHLAFRSFWLHQMHLAPRRKHTAEDLAGLTDWASRPRGQRIAIGRCFKLFEARGVLPIWIVNPDAKYNFKYRLNETLDAPPIH